MQQGWRWDDNACAMLVGARGGIGEEKENIDILGIKSKGWYDKYRGPSFRRKAMYHFDPGGSLTLTTRLLIRSLKLASRPYGRHPGGKQV